MILLYILLLCLTIVRRLCLIFRTIFLIILIVFVFVLCFSVVHRFCSIV